VTGYGLDGPDIESRARFFAPVQTGPGAHPTSCIIGTESFQGVKSGRSVIHQTTPVLHFTRQHLSCTSPDNTCPALHQTTPVRHFTRQHLSGTDADSVKPVILRLFVMESFSKFKYLRNTTTVPLLYYYCTTTVPLLFFVGITGKQTKDRQRTYNVTLRSVAVTTVVVAKQQVLYIVNVSVCV
jgi:hypothetical protein